MCLYGRQAEPWSRKKRSLYSISIPSTGVDSTGSCLVNPILAKYMYSQLSCSVPIMPNFSALSLMREIVLMPAEILQSVCRPEDKSYAN